MNNQTCLSSRRDVIDAIRGALATIEAAHGTTNDEGADELFGCDNDTAASNLPEESLDESLRSAYSALQSAVGMLQQRGRVSALAEHKHKEESTNDVIHEAEEQQEGTVTVAPHRPASGTDARPTPLTPSEHISSSTPHGIIWGQQPSRPLDSTPQITLTDAVGMKGPPPPAEIIECGKKLLAIRKQMASKGFGPADKAKNPTKNNPRAKLSPEELHRSMLRQVALSLALQKGRLDIVRLMVGKDGAFDYEPSSSQAALDMTTTPSKESMGAKRGRAIDEPESDEATTRLPADGPEADEEQLHLGWDPHFNTSDAERIRDGAVTAYPILRLFIQFEMSPLPGMPPAPSPGIGIRINGFMAYTSLNALHRACYYGHLPIVKHLVEVCGMDVNEPTTYIGEYYRRAPRHSTLYPIHFAVRNAASSGDMSVVRYLVHDQKCDKDSRMFFSTEAIIPSACKENVKSSNVYEALKPGYTALDMIIDSGVWMSEGDTRNFEAPRYRSRVALSLLGMGFGGNAEANGRSQVFARALSSLMKSNDALVDCLETVDLRFFRHQRQVHCLKKEIQSAAVTLNGIQNCFPSLCGNLEAQLSKKDLAFHYSSSGRAVFMPLYCACPRFYRLSDSKLEEIREHFSTASLQMVLANGTSVDPNQAITLFSRTTREHCQLMIDCGFDPSAVTTVRADEIPKFQSARSHEAVDYSVDDWKANNPQKPHIIIDYPLRNAALFQRDDIINLLIDNGVDPNQAHPKTNKTALFESRSAVVLRALIARGANANWRDFHGRNALHNFVNFSPSNDDRTGRIVSELLRCFVFEAKCDLYARDSGKRGMTPLHAWAARECSKLIGDICGIFWNQRLSDHSSTLNLSVRDNFGFTPLHMAALWSTSALQKMLLWRDKLHEDGKTTVIVIDVNAHTTADSQHWGNDSDEIGTEDDHDRDYFKHAKFCTKRSYSQLLSEPLAQPSAATLPPVIVSGSTALHAAATWGQYESCRLLLGSVHCNPNALDSRGQTALHTATRGAHIKIVRLFLANKRVNASTKDNDGLTAKDIAVAKHTLNSNKKEVSDAWQLSWLLMSCFPHT